MTQTINVISLWQPWASLWLSLRKKHETRHWSTDHRGWTVAHATKRFARDVEPELRDILEDEFGDHWAKDLPTGGLIGMVHISNCRRAEDIVAEYASKDGADWLPASTLAPDDYHCGDFSDGRFGFEADKAFTFKAPIPFLGRQSKFLDVPVSMLALEAQAVLTP